MTDSVNIINELCIRLQDENPEELSRSLKAFALELASDITQDEAQVLYRFAVLVTKLT